MSDSEPSNGWRWSSIDPGLWDAAAVAVPFPAVDLGPYIEACDEAVRDLAYRYDATPARPLFEEGVTVGHQVMWSGVPGPARIRPVALLVDSDGHMSVEPTGEWQDTTVVGDSGEQP
jgi:hypothetical protein